MIEMRPDSILAGGMPDPSTMTVLLQLLSKLILGYIQGSVGRHLSADERDLVMHEPRCLAW